MSTLLLGVYTCEPQRVDKTNYITYDATYYDVVILENGTNEDEYRIVIDSPIETTRQYNYAKIDGREYFLEPVGAVDGGMSELVARADVLFQNRERIYNSEQVVERNETIYQSYLKDNEMNYAEYELIDCYQFPQGMTDDTIILMTVG